MQQNASACAHYMQNNLVDIWKSVTRSRHMEVWSEEGMLKLIEIWGEDNIQAMLKGSKHNKDVFNKISHQMDAYGYKKTADECNNKIFKLKPE